jgi:hypothetical protein
MSWSVPGENWVWPLPRLLRSVKGVAGALPGLLPSACMFGDLPAERGIDGGGIRMSVRGSGLTESGPEPSLLLTGLRPSGAGLAPISLLLAFRELGLRRPWDFESGDCLALRAGVRLETLNVRPHFLAIEREAPAAFDVSRWGSIGESVGPVSGLDALG